MTEHLLDATLSRAASILGLGLIVARLGAGGVRATIGLVGSALVVAGTLGQLFVGTFAIAGRLSADAVVEVVLGTAFGATAATAIGAGALLVVAHAIASGRSPGDRVASAAAPIAFAWALSAQGHGAEPHTRTLVHAIHLGAASVWLGGLVVLVDGVEREAGSRARAVIAFSRLALWLVIVVLGTGIARAAAHVRSVTQLGDDYGRVLLLKLGLGAGALAFAVRHRRRTLPVLSSRAEIPRAFERDVAAELVLVLCTLLAATALGQLPPPRD